MRNDSRLFTPCGGSHLRNAPFQTCRSICRSPGEVSRCASDSEIAPLSTEDSYHLVLRRCYLEVELQREWQAAPAWVPSGKRLVMLRIMGARDA
jgi:hypothetical protein